MEHSGHALSGLLLIACGLVWLAALQGGSWRGYWYLPPAQDTQWLASLGQLPGLIVMLAGAALLLGWPAFGLAGFLPF